MLVAGVSFEQLFQLFINELPSFVLLLGVLDARNGLTTEDTLGSRRIGSGKRPNKRVDSVIVNVLKWLHLFGKW